MNPLFVLISALIIINVIALVNFTISLSQKKHYCKGDDIWYVMMDTKSEVFKLITAAAPVIDGFIAFGFICYFFAKFLVYVHIL